MRVAFRVDAAPGMGLGHLQRCMALAYALREAGAEVCFVCRDLQLDVGPRLQSYGLPLLRLAAPGVDEAPDSEPAHAPWLGVGWARDAADTIDVLRAWRADWVVVDHYAIDARWHGEVAGSLGVAIAAIDDLADRPLLVRLLIDHNFAEPDHRHKYNGRIAADTEMCGGPRFALLGPAYAGAARYAFHPEVRSIGIFMGGTDPENASARALACCRAAGFTGAVEIAATSAHPHLEELRRACETDPCATLIVDAPDLAGFFGRHGVQIGAGGGATWERCCMGAPTIALVLATNQAVVVPALDKLGALRAARLDDEPAPFQLPALSDVLRQLLPDAHTRQALAARASALVDGRGAQRVALMLMADGLRLRPADQNDDALLHAWRNHPSVRAVSGSSAAIDMAAHRSWLAGVLADSQRWLFVAQVGQLPVGSIRFDHSADDGLEVSLYLDPDLQGLGLGRRLLLTGEQAMRARWVQGFTIHAVVQPGNTASQRLFQACGYDGGPLSYQKRISPPTSAVPCHEDS